MFLYNLENQLLKAFHFLQSDQMQLIYFLNEEYFQTGQQNLSYFVRQQLVHLKEI